MQRGTKSQFTLNPNETTRIDITNVNPDKSILLLDWQMTDTGAGAPIFNLLNNAIVITNTDNRGAANIAYICGLSYQVVEFY